MNERVMQIAQINFKGNVIDHGWYEAITMKNGKPYMVAIVLLSEIVYWYRPTEVRDEQTNEIIYKQKFSSDKLQKSYQQLADTFGFTKRQIKDACDHLKRLGLIETEFRTVNIKGIPNSNVLFIEPVPEAIKAISKLYTPLTLQRNTPLHSNVGPSYVTTEDPPTPERRTYTDITTKITTGITNNNKVNRKSDSYSAEFEEFWKLYPRKVDKKMAYREWNRVRKKNSAQKIMDGLAGYKREIERKKTATEYIKHAKTFLHNECFKEYEGGEEVAKSSGRPEYEGYNFDKEFTPNF
ncbi:hypothetical protein J26TS2_30310 [Shouchella clausii]|nr:hypothetical protein J26TS2_30310 [Shouchella clausii]